MNKIEHIKNVLNSFEKLTGKTIINRTTPEADFLEIESAEFVLVSHNGAEDPILNYGNQFALKLWEMSWNDFIKTPSRKTAEPDLRVKRGEMLSIVSKQGYYENFFNWYEDIKPYRRSTVFSLFYLLKFNWVSRKIITIYRSILRRS